MDRDMLQSIYAHASSANEKLFETAAQISEAGLTHAASASKSILALPVHLVDVQRTWLARAAHRSPAARPGCLLNRMRSIERNGA